ncbi:acetyl esterase [Alteribacillus persepolensis]|uniref:Acetyl esterase n=1 Tax=Alteribacillus persepolensis TaxID=568899 RepID=A0A1G7Z945_9BACI|nr:alpha/beta hydrolase [Alteribacillus persepolensis]SDH05129.1 acetyl esterase [Alteribacillus persepolensis]
MWKKLLTVTVVLNVIVSLMIAWFMEEWSHTAQGKLPSKTAVILHAVNNNLVTVDADIEPPGFLLSASKKSEERELIREDTTIPLDSDYTLPVRIYHYADLEHAPVILYFHGGAFLEGYGSIDTHDNIVRALAEKTEAVVVSPGYRVAPDHVFPTAVNDSYQSLKWVYENAEKWGGNPEKIAVAGDSAGGNLAAVTALKSRDLHGPEIIAQLLYYPLTTFKDVKLESRTAYDSGYYLLSRQVMLKARNAYTPKEDMWNNPYTSPLEADTLDGLPPAMIMTAQYDPLRDEGELYAEKLHEAGVPVQAVRYNGVMHGFVSFFEVMKSGEMALNESELFLDKAAADEIVYDDEFSLTVQKVPAGMQRVREEAEAFAIAAFLVGKRTLTTLIP